MFLHHKDTILLRDTQKGKGLWCENLLTLQTFFSKEPFPGAKTDFSTPGKGVLRHQALHLLLSPQAGHEA